MGVDYRRQYKPEHLEPFFPHEIVKMIIVVLSTLAVLMFLVVLPTIFSFLGLEGYYHKAEPADPAVTPPHMLYRPIRLPDKHHRIFPRRR